MNSNSTKRRRVGQPKPRSQHARVFNAQGIVYNACNVETERTKQIEFDLKHARDANERVEASQPLQRDARSLESKESTRTRDPLPSKEDKPSKALAALDHLQWKDRTCHSTIGRRDFHSPHVEPLRGELVYYKLLISLA